MLRAHLDNQQEQEQQQQQPTRIKMLALKLSISINFRCYHPTVSEQSVDTTRAKTLSWLIDTSSRQKY